MNSLHTIAVHPLEPIQIIWISSSLKYGLNWEKEAVNSLNINVICEADRNQAVPLQQAGLIQPPVACLPELTTVCAHRLCHKCLLDLAGDPCLLCLYIELLTCRYGRPASPQSLEAITTWSGACLPSSCVYAHKVFVCSSSKKRRLCVSDGLLLLCYQYHLCLYSSKTHEDLMAIWKVQF